MEIKKVFVVGSGLMGGGIAQVSAAAGYQVKMHDVKEEFVEKGLENIRFSLGKFLSKEKITQEQHDAALANITPTTSLEDAADCDFTCEAVFENLDVKKEVFAKLDEVCPPHAILASNTSAIPISSIAAATKRPDQVVGTHFFSPVPMMRLCEIIRGLQTSDETMDAAVKWAQSVGKQTVVVQKDHAGSSAPPLPGHERGGHAHAGSRGGHPQDIDKAMKLGRFPMGPLELADMTGIDIGTNAMMATQRHRRPSTSRLPWRAA